MNKHKFLFSIRPLLFVAMLFVSGALMAQTAFRKGALYNLFPATDGRLVLQLDGDKATFQNMDAAAKGQYWTVTDLSGSVRIINPFANQALRADGDKVGVGENNGSDEAQLWKVELFEGKMRGAVVLVPANRPEVAMCREANGTLSLTGVEESGFNLDDALPIILEDVKGTDNFASWTVFVDGRKIRRKVKYSEGRICVPPVGLVMIVK